MEEKRNKNLKVFFMIRGIKNKVVSNEEDNIYLMERTKKGRNPFTPKKSLHAKKKETNKGFEKSKIL